jgi:hypothetical protein
MKRIFFFRVYKRKKIDGLVLARRPGEAEYEEMLR